MEISLFFVLLLAGIFHAESKFMVYDTSPRLVPGKINVHLVAHTHDDVGWLKTVDQYYVGSNNSIQGACVENVLDSMVTALLADKNRKFIYVEQCFNEWEMRKVNQLSESTMYRAHLSRGIFQRWWRDQSETVQGIVKQLVRSGQLEFINGGMCMHDEAATHYIDMVDQTTLGHRFLKKEFGVTPRIGWQIDPFGHSAVQAYLLGAEVGFDALYFGRIDYQDRDKRKGEKSLEIFAGAFPENYEPPPGGFYFEVNDDSPIVQDDINLFDYNVQDRVNDFVAAAVSQANITRTNHIMWTMGTDFKYQYAHTWFRQMDKLIHYVNKDGRVNALYSTPSIYTDAKFATNESWPIKTDDFFPYADSANAYWTGYFTSRPAIKRYVRMMSGYYLAARQLEFFKGRSDSGPTTDALADALAIAQHHDAVTGTEKQHVASDYAKRLSMGYDKAEELVAASLACLAESMPSAGCGNPTTKFQQAKDYEPLSYYCPPSEIDLSHGKKLIVVVYNSLGWKRDDVIRIPVINEDVTVHDSNGKVIESQILPLVNAHVGMRSYYVKAYLASTLTTSSVFTPRAMETSTVEVGQGNLRLTFSADVGKMTHYTNSRSLVKEPVQLSYSFYTGNDGSDKDPQASGAYIFRPNRTFVIKPEEESPLTVMRGPLLDEVHQRINPWIYQVTRLYKGKEHAEVEFAVGPIPIDDGIGKEVATQITTTMATNKTFYTDSNGRDFIKRIRDYRTDWDLKVNQPVAGNYYPINLGIYIQDDKTELSVLVDRSVGGSSIADGQIELMLHRRLLHDDSKGVAEALNETVCIHDKCTGLTDILVERFQFGHVCVGGWGQDGPIFYIKLYARRFGPVLILSGIDGIRWYGDVSGAGSSSFFSSLGPLIKYFFAIRIYTTSDGPKMEYWDPLTVFSTSIESTQNTNQNGTISFDERIDPLGEGAKWRRSAGQEIYSPFLLAFTEEDGDNWMSSHVPTFSGIDPSYSLPDNVALITLQELDDGKVLLRLAHLYEIGEDKDLSVMSSVELKKLFPGKKISKVTEMSLSANQEREEMEQKRLVWKVEGSPEKEPELARGRPVNPTNLVVELAPMEIRTFVIEIGSLPLRKSQMPEDGRYAA
ncbi:putative alpha-mannosidase [Vitis vinifera]|uniref:alpha-mannosidase n=1 Tax=Vitis vinifera TaxID=29760 RepID=A0A438ECM8_VITVI|nr:putative alpha-mannosidase [Vitis vinifera]